MFTQAAQQSLQRIRCPQLSFLASRLTDRIHKSIPESANNLTATQQDLHIISIFNTSKKRIECNETRPDFKEKSQIIKNLDLIEPLFFGKSLRHFQKDIWRNRLKNIFSVSVRFFATSHQNTRNRDRRGSFMEQLGSKENISQLTLTDIKNLAKDIPQGWLNDESIRSIYKKVYHQHFRDLIKFTHSDIYELEKLVFVFYWGQAFIDYQNKGEIWEIYMSLLTKDANDSRIDSRTIYTYCKALNQIASTSHLNSSELREALTLLLELLENKRTLDEFYMRGVIFVLNTLLLQSELNYFSKEISQCLALVKTFTFTNEKVANMALFTLNNFKILLEDDEDLSQEVKACLDRVPLSEYIRRDVEDSNTQRKIANILLDMGFLIEENQLVGIYSVDFLLKPKLILEYHGGSHYYVNNQEMIQIHQVKVRVLKKMGYHVQVIPYYKWSILESRQRQESYLREIIYEPFYKLGQRV